MWEAPFILREVVSVQPAVRNIDIRGILRSSRRQVGCDFEKTSLYQEVPDTTGLIDINLHEIPCFSAPKLASTTSILSDEGFLDDKIWFG